MKSLTACTGREHLAQNTQAAVESTAKEAGRKVEDTAEETNNLAKIAAPAGWRLNPSFDFEST